MPQIIETLTEEQIPKFLAYFERPVTTMAQRLLLCRDRLICLLMLDAGLRVGEVVRLNLSDLLFQGEPVQGIVLNHTTAEKGCTRTVPVTRRLQDAIALMNLNVWQPQEMHPNASPFAFTIHDSRLTARTIERMTFHVGCSTIGRPVNPHMLRHTFATRLMRTTSIRVVQQLLGHASLASTQVYTHPNNEDLQKAIATLA